VTKWRASLCGAPARIKLAELLAHNVPWDDAVIATAVWIECVGYEWAFTHMQAAHQESIGLDSTSYVYDATAKTSDLEKALIDTFDEADKVRIIGEAYALIQEAAFPTWAMSSSHARA
jgi:hypothetical protein